MGFTLFINQFQKAGVFSINVRHDSNSAYFKQRERDPEDGLEVDLGLQQHNPETLGWMIIPISSPFSFTLPSRSPRSKMTVTKLLRRIRLD